MKKKLNLKKESLRVLNSAELGNAAGGTLQPKPSLLCTIIFQPPTSLLTTITTKPSAVDGCPSALGCTINTSIVQTINQLPGVKG